MKTRSLLRRPFADRRRPEELKSITAAPWSLRPMRRAERIDMGPTVELHPKLPAEAPSDPRRLKITIKTLTTYGTTDGCAQCAHVRAFGEYVGFCPAGTGQVTSRSPAPRITRKTNIDSTRTGRVSWASEVEDAQCGGMLAPADDETAAEPCELAAGPAKHQEWA